MYRPDDWHVHFRWGKMMEHVIPYTAKLFGRALVMPNLTQEGMILNADHARIVWQEVYDSATAHKCPYFTPVVSIRLTPQTTPEIIQEAKDDFGLLVAKLYPDGVTTGSEGGVSDFSALGEVFSKMQELDIVLSLHGELPGATPLTAEQEFIPVLEELLKDFPTLRVVVEHITTREMLEVVHRFNQDRGRIGATITAHHLVLTTDQVYMNGKVAFPHNYCKPVAKTKADQEALVRVATSGCGYIWFGSDTAPHSVAKKECENPAAGVFSAPVALPVLAEVFEAADSLDKLESFIGIYGAEFYGLDRNARHITFKKKSWQVPMICRGDVVPFLAGQQLSWQVTPS